MVDLVIEAPDDFSAVILADCCDHIQTSWAELVATKKELKKSLDMARAAFPDPTTSYIMEIEHKLNTSAALKAC